MSLNRAAIVSLITTAGACLGQQIANPGVETSRAALGDLPLPAAYSNAAPSLEIPFAGLGARIYGWGTSGGGASHAQFGRDGLDLFDEGGNFGFFSCGTDTDPDTDGDQNEVVLQIVDHVFEDGATYSWNAWLNDGGANFTITGLQIGYLTDVNDPTTFVEVAASDDVDFFFINQLEGEPQWSQSPTVSYTASGTDDFLGEHVVLKFNTSIGFGDVWFDAITFATDAAVTPFTVDLGCQNIADFNNDDVLDIFDILAFFDEFAIADCAAPSDLVANAGFETPVIPGGCCGGRPDPWGPSGGTASHAALPKGGLDNVDEGAQFAFFSMNNNENFRQTLPLNYNEGKTYEWGAYLNEGGGGGVTAFTLGYFDDNDQFVEITDARSPEHDTATVAPDWGDFTGPDDRAALTVEPGADYVGRAVVIAYVTSLGDGANDIWTDEVLFITDDTASGFVCPSPANVNGDSSVDIFDILGFFDLFGQGC